MEALGETVKGRSPVSTMTYAYPARPGKLRIKVPQGPQFRALVGFGGQHNRAHRWLLDRSGWIFRSPRPCPGEQTRRFAGGVALCPPAAARAPWQGFRWCNPVEGTPVQRFPPAQD